MSEIGPLSRTLRRVLDEVRAANGEEQHLVDRHIQEALGLMADWVSDHDALLQWNGAEGLNGATASTLAPAAGSLSADIDLVLTDANNSQNPFDESTTVVVTVTGGTATSPQIGSVPQAGDLTPSGSSVTTGGAAFSEASTQPSWSLPGVTLGTGPITVTMQDGKAVVRVSAATTGTVILGLSSPSNAALTVSDTLTVTFS